jgi:glucan phosphoethanolaminetransferase (alkaline phosphatase superfamily)
MIPLPKPRGFWDYALFALAMTGALLLLFRLEASDGVGWADAALAFAAAVLFVLAIILTRRREKAAWILHRNWLVDLIATLGAFVLMFAATYADAYILHRKDISTHRLQHDVVFAVAVTAATLWSSLRRSAKRQLS